MKRAYNSKIAPSIKFKSDSYYIRDIEDKSPENFFSDKTIREMISEIRSTENLKLLETLVHSFGRYVLSIAKNYQEQGLSLGDLVSEGMLGLIQAIHKFDISNPTKFVTYSNAVISRYMKEALDYSNNIVKLPKNIRNRRMQMKSLIDSMRAGGASELEILEVIDAPADLIYYYTPNLYSKKSIDEVTDDGEALNLYDRITLEDEELKETIKQSDLKADVQLLLRTKLTDAEALVIEYTFGINLPYAVTSIKEISKRLGLPKATIKSLRDSANQKLRDEDSIKILSKYI